jgi:hypothetical protein
LPVEQEVVKELKQTVLRCHWPVEQYVDAQPDTAQQQYRHNEHQHTLRALEWSRACVHAASAGEAHRASRSARAAAGAVTIAISAM